MISVPSSVRSNEQSVSTMREYESKN